METIYRDQSVCELWKQDKIARGATHSLLRALITQVEELFPNPLLRGQLPAAVQVARHTSSEKTTIVGDTGLVVEDASTGERLPVFPAEFSLGDYLVLHHTVDRGSTGGGQPDLLHDQPWLHVDRELGLLP